MLNFNLFDLKKKTYGGANGNKFSVIINDELYMLKLPSYANKNKDISYSNSTISEFLGSHIFNIVGISAQETILGTYTYKNITRIAVACKDFEKDGYILKDFASLKNQIIDSTSNGYGTELSDLLEVIESQVLIDPILLSKHFWNMFVLDSLLGNWDRHNGNWGFLYNQDSDDIKIAPIFDCGSCLFAQLDENFIDKILKSKQELNARVFDFPTSALTINKKRINYFNFINSHSYKECDEALKRIKNKINFNEINKLIDSVECISNNHKLFLKTILKMRYDAFFNI